MNFALTEEQIAIREAVESVCSDFTDEYWLRKDREGGFPEDFYRAMAGAGWLGMAQATACGGAGPGISEAAELIETGSASRAELFADSAAAMHVFVLHPTVVPALD